MFYTIVGVTFSMSVNKYRVIALASLPLFGVFELPLGVRRALTPLPVRSKRRYDEVRLFVVYAKIIR